MVAANNIEIVWKELKMKIKATYRGASWHVFLFAWDNAFGDIGHVVEIFFQEVRQ